MKKLLTAVVAMALTGAAAPSLAAGDAEAGKAKSAVCASCHGADGSSPLNPMWPKLAGQHANYIATQLKHFKDGTRKDAQMSPMAMPLSDQDMEDLAAYFASLPVTTGEADPALVAQGETIYRGGNIDSGVAACMSCHGPAGKGNGAANFPALAGQHATYVESTLGKFASGDRANDPAAMMRDVAAKMSPAEMKAVASYINGLH